VSAVRPLFDGIFLARFGRPGRIAVQRLVAQRSGDVGKPEA
jgi:hypothetical protein